MANRRPDSAVPVSHLAVSPIVRTAEPEILPISRLRTGVRGDASDRWRVDMSAGHARGLNYQLRPHSGVAGNWQWWAFTLTGVATVFFYARLWRRLGVLTDREFYGAPYSGKAASRIATVLLFVLSSALVFALDTAQGSFNIILQIGGGTGLLYLLRWFWWRVNAWCEIIAMISSFLTSVVLLVLTRKGVEIGAAQGLIIVIAVTTVCWILTAYVGPPPSRGAR